jgi:hypothetical protein
LCFKVREVRYLITEGSKSKSGRLALGNGKGCQSRNMCKWYGYFVPRDSGHIKKGVSTCLRSSQVVNRRHVVKCSNHYQPIMKARKMNNHGVRIMYALQSLSPVLYTRGCAMENLQFNSKHLFAMNSVFLGTIPPFAQSVINYRCSTPILFVKSNSFSICKFSRKPRLIEFSASGIH